MNELWQALEYMAEQSHPRTRDQWAQVTAIPKGGSRSPAEWEPNGPMTIEAGIARQIVPRRPGRQTVFVTNTGLVNSVLIFRHGSNARAVPNRYRTVGPGVSLSIDTEAPLQAYSAGGTTLEIDETFWGLSALSQKTETDIARVAGVEPAETPRHLDMPLEPAEQPPAGVPLVPLLRG